MPSEQGEPSVVALGRLCQDLLDRVRVLRNARGMAAALVGERQLEFHASCRPPRLKKRGRSSSLALTDHLG
ncbi:hypothetical protein JK361_29990 [Streptomyces sp. 5-8]|uniref:Uncharacterized protein n=1 Tax=Streptomyces musisoli TaxID=2802280 RepID=A0ABS1P8R2_9ACTN|nr:hypothetical protein [Streptomyces musisoli]MBL1108766.1 hypothetical protein [Streptomyces musisoli]